MVILLSRGLWRVNRHKETFPLDLRDRLLLYMALTESVLTVVYHILFNHLIFLFVLRVAKTLEQVTLSLIMLELTLKKENFNLRSAFT
jgi:hypothetical protein